MPQFIYINCPNCKVKIKIDYEKKYHDCPDCKHEFKIDDPEKNTPSDTASAGTESIFGKFMREKGL